jgi:hypothetical protein
MKEVNLSDSPPAAATGLARVISHDTSRLICIGVMVLLVAGWLAYIRAFGVNFPFWDEWELGKFYERFYRGQLSLVELLAAKHNEHLIGVGFAVMLLHHLATGFDTKALLYTDFALHLFAFALLLYGARHLLPRGGQRFAHVAIASLFALSFAPYTNILWSFQTPWFLIGALLMMTVVALGRVLENDRLAWVLVAAGTATLASFCSVQGLAVWVAGTVYLLAGAGRPLRQTLRWRPFRVWMVCAVVGLVLYAAISRLNPSSGPSSLSASLTMLAQPWDLLRFVLLMLGNVAGYLRPRAAMFAGLVVALLLCAIAYTALRDQEPRRRAMPLALIAFAATFVAMVTAGRAPLGLEAARESRYSMYVLPILAVGYMVMARGELGGVARVPFVLWSRAAFATVAVLAFVSSAHHALVHGHAWRTERGLGAIVLLDYDLRPATTLERLVYGNAEMVERQAGFLRATAQSTFRDGPAAVPAAVRVYLQPPASFVQLGREHPERQPALAALWQAYLGGPDVRSAIPPVAPDFPAKLVKWASGAARDGGHYLSPILKPYADDYARLSATLDARRR